MGIVLRIVGVPTLELILADRTKVFLLAESLDSTVERLTRTARLRLEREEEKKIQTRIHTVVIG